MIPLLAMGVMFCAALFTPAEPPAGGTPSAIGGGQVPCADGRDTGLAVGQLYKIRCFQRPDGSVSSVVFY